MLVSFIIPSYNSAHTVKRCLDSIYALSLKPEEFEVIFIDDCSTDYTVSIIENFKFQVSNLTLLRQPKNNRQGAARNRGMSVAKGEYICFVDSDDMVTDGIVDAIRLAKEKQTDMTAFHMAFVGDKGEITHEQEHLSFSPDQIISGIEFQNKYPYWCSGPVAYVYSREFLNSTSYPFREGVLYEDSDFVAMHLYYVRRMAYSSTLGYLAYYREGSTTHSISYRNVSDYLLLGARMLALYDKITEDQLTNERLSELSSGEIVRFAEGILEGACFNVAKSCRRLVKLDSIGDVRAFYERVDSMTDANALYTDKRLRKYYWSVWTSICLGHKCLAIILLTLLLPIFKQKNRRD